MRRRLARNADGRWRLVRRLALAGAAVAAPAVAHALIQSRRRAPEAPAWGRTRRFAGHLGPVVFQEIGAGEPVVLLHALGPGFDTGQWRGVAEALAPRFLLLAPDLPGWGRSAPLAQHPDIYLANLADFLSGVTWNPAVLVAAGHAAPYAVYLAAEHPELVKGVVLVAPLGLHAGGVGSRAPVTASEAAGDTVARPELDDRPLLADLLAVPILRISVLDALTSRAALAMYLRNCAYAAPERVDAALLEHHYRVSHLPPHRQALAAFWRGELELPAAATLRHLQVPAEVILGGEEGPRLTAADDLPPGTKVEVITGTRALPHAERPLAVSEALARFLTALPTA